MAAKTLKLFSLIGWLILISFNLAWAKLKVSFPGRVYQGDCYWVRIVPDKRTTPLYLLTDHKKIKLPQTRSKKISLLLGTGVQTKKDQVFSLLYQEKSYLKKKTFLVKVMAKSFAVQHLHLPKKMVFFKPKVLSRIKREKKLVHKILNQITSDQFLDKIVRPTSGIILSPFGVKRILNGQPRSYHRGVDFRARLGTPIYSFSTGKVVLTRSLFFGGNTVIIDHGLGVYSLYMHLQKILVSSGQMVKAGQIIGRAGMTGRATGPHLHFGLFVLGKSVNPLALFK